MNGMRKKGGGESVVPPRRGCGQRFDVNELKMKKQHHYVKLSTVIIKNKGNKE